MLLDYGDFVVHVFQDGVREFYIFDQLGGTAPEVPVDLLPSHRLGNGKYGGLARKR